MSDDCGQGQEQLQTMLDTVEKVRIDRFPDLDKVLVESLLRLHVDSSTSNTDLLRAIEKAVEQYLEME